MANERDGGTIALVGVDDQITSSLERHVEVVAVETSGECLDLLDDCSVEAIVTAHDLPESTGLDLLGAVREADPSIPVILSPADGSERLAGEALAAGASGYASETEPPDSLIAQLERCLDDTGILGEETGRYRNLIETSPAPINLFDADGVTVWGNDALVELLGLEDRSELVGRSIFEFIHPEDRSIAKGELEEIVEAEVPTGPTYMRLVRENGEVRHVRIATAPGRFRGRRIGQALAVDVTPIRRHEQRLERLNQLLAECLEAETTTSVCEATVRAAGGTLGLPQVSIALLDEATGDLEPVAHTVTGKRHLKGATLFARGDGAAWRAFTTGDPVTTDPPPDHDTGDAEEWYAVPLGRHGVIVAGIPTEDREFVRLIAENVQGMIERLHRERILQEREERLMEQNEMLGRLDRLNRIIRRIDAELVGATTRAEIDTAICRELVETDLFTFAWIGDYEPSTDRIVPRHSAGEGRSYLDAITVTADDAETGHGPAGRAVRTRAPQVVDDVLTDPPFEPWREAAISRGFRSGISLPLVYRESLYGVLNIYASQPGVFDDLERQTLAELSDVIAHAINAIESKQALVSDAVVELELGLKVDGATDPLMEFVASAPDRSFELQAVVPGSEGGYRAIVSFSGVTPDEVTSLGRRALTVERSRVIADRDGTVTAEAVLTADNLLFWLVDRGAVPRSFTVDQSDARLVVELAGDADVREFVEQLEAAFAPVELLGRTDRERTVQTPAGFLASLEGHLTKRQREVLETAYFSGYFESPRRRTGAEVAEALGISQPTFSDHLRTGLGTMFGLLFDPDDTRGAGDGDTDSVRQ